MCSNTQLQIYFPGVNSISTYILAFTHLPVSFLLVFLCKTEWNYNMAPSSVPNEYSQIQIISISVFAIISMQRLMSWINHMLHIKGFITKTKLKAIYGLWVWHFTDQQFLFSYWVWYLTDWYLMTFSCIYHPNHHWFRKWLVNCAIQRRYWS